MPLPDGLVLRAARPDDLHQIGDLLAARGDAADRVDHELVVHDPDGGFDSCAVVVDGDRVVSTATLLDETVFIEGHAVPAGQVELVATHAAYEGRGLVRALMDWAHERSRQRGHLLQVMVGIPFFYRQFGYAYIQPMGVDLRLGALPPAPPVTVRRATADDIPAMHALEERVQDDFGLRMPHTAACWRWLVARDGSQQWVAERDGHVVATARTIPPEEGVRIGELAGSGDGALAIAHTARAAARGADVHVVSRTGTTAFSALEPYLEPAGPHAKPDWYYGRVESLAALLGDLSPVLVDRVRRAGVTERHDVLLSAWRHHVRFTIGPDGMSPVVAGGPEQRPISKGGSGVPPDGIAPLLLGPYGALGLEARLADCYLGRQRDLMAALFPPLRADILTFFLP